MFTRLIPQWKIIATVALSTALILFDAQAQTPENSSLYKRLGGYDVIAAAVDDFLERYDNDPKLASFLGGLNAAESARIRQHFVDWICARTGGPCLYLGRDMVATHEGLKITATHFDIVMQHLDAAFDRVRLDVREKQELVSILENTRDQMVVQ